MKDFELVYPVSVTIVGMWLAANLIFMIFGLGDKTLADKELSACNNEMRRIEFLMPGYEVGCWLGDYPKD